MIVLTGLQDTPVPVPTIDPDLVTPGPLGFAAMALIVVAVIALCLDLMRRVRRTRYRAEANEALDAEEAALPAHDQRRLGDER